MTECARCGSVGGTHQRGCVPLPGHGIGQKRRRTAAETERWNYLKIRAIERDDWRCRICGVWSSLLDVHHVETVQTVFARGGGWADADRLPNLLAVCRSCHEWAHSAAGIDDARLAGWIIDRTTR